MVASKFLESIGAFGFGITGFTRSLSAGIRGFGLMSLGMRDLMVNNDPFQSDIVRANTQQEAAMVISKHLKRVGALGSGFIASIVSSLSRDAKGFGSLHDWHSRPDARYRSAEAPIVTSLRQQRVGALGSGATANTSVFTKGFAVMALDHTAFSDGCLKPTYCCAKICVQAHDRP